MTMTAGEKAKAKWLKQQAYRKEYMPEYYQLNKESYKAYKAERIKKMTPEQLEKHRAYHREYQREYYKKKRVKTKRQAYQKEYYQRKKRAIEQLKKSQAIESDSHKELQKIAKQAAEAYRELSDKEKLDRIRKSYENRIVKF